MKTVFQKKILIALSLLSLIFFCLFFSSCKKNTVQQNTSSANENAQQNPQPTSTLEFINFSIDNVDTSYSGTTDQMLYHGGDSVETSSFFPNIGVGAIHHYGTDSNFILINFAKNGIALGSAQRLSMIIETNYTVIGPTSLTPVYVNITEYGNVGQYISGNFSDQLIDRYGDPHAVSVDFRIKRTN